VLPRSRVPAQLPLHAQDVACAAAGDAAAAAAAPADNRVSSAGGSVDSSSISGDRPAGCPAAGPLSLTHCERGVYLSLPFGCRLERPAPGVLRVLRPGVDVGLAFAGPWGAQPQLMHASCVVRCRRQAGTPWLSVLPPLG
jgi:hypothetical protein